jgi:hypothetical protein
MVCPNWPTLKPGTHAWYTRHAGREPVNVEDQARMRKGHPTGPLPPDFRSRDRSSPATRSLIPGVSASRSPAVAAVVPLHPCGDRRRDAGEHDAHADHPVTDTNQDPACQQAAHEREESDQGSQAAEILIHRTLTVTPRWLPAWRPVRLEASGRRHHRLEDPRARLTRPGRAEQGGLSLR